VFPGPQIASEDAADRECDGRGAAEPRATAGDDAIPIVIAIAIT
jgi:hypothetical protein